MIHDLIWLVSPSILTITTIGEIRHQAIQEVRNYFREYRPSQFRRLPSKRAMYAHPQYWGLWTIPAWDKWLKNHDSFSFIKG